MNPKLIVSRYIDNNNGTLTDPSTGLMWQRIAVGQAWGNGLASGDPDFIIWDNAILKDSKAGWDCYEGFKDWRLPNFTELESVTRKAIPYINSLIFPGCPEWFFWTTFQDAEGKAMSISMPLGNPVSIFKHIVGAVRLVRNI